MKIRNILLILGIILIPSVVIPQSGGTFNITKSVIAGGGGNGLDRRHI